MAQGDPREPLGNGRETSTSRVGLPVAKTWSVKKSLDRKQQPSLVGPAPSARPGFTVSPQSLFLGSPPLPCFPFPGAQGGPDHHRPGALQGCLPTPLHVFMVQ